MGRYQRTEGRAVIAGVLCFLLGALACWTQVRTGQLESLGPNIQFLISALFVSVPGTLAFVFGYTSPNQLLPAARHRWATRIRRFFEIAALSVVFFSTVLLAVFCVLLVLYQMVGFELGGLYFQMIVAALAAATGYLGYSQGALLDAKTVSSFLPFFVIAGIAVAGLTTDDPKWWHNNFSELGDSTSFSATTFNFTIIMSGICLIIIGYFAVFELIASNEQYLSWRKGAGLPVTMSARTRRRRRSERRKKEREALDRASANGTKAVVDEMRTIAIRKRPGLAEAARAALEAQDRQKKVSGPAASQTEGVSGSAAAPAPSPVPLPPMAQGERGDLPEMASRTALQRTEEFDRSALHQALEQAGSSPSDAPVREGGVEGARAMGDAARGRQAAAASEGRGHRETRDDATLLRERLEEDTSALVSHYRLRMGLFLSLVILAGVSLAGVGVFRYTPHPDMHNLCARGMMVPMYLLLLLLPVIVPHLSRIVYALGWAEMVVIAGAGVLWMRGLTTLTNVEGLTWVLFLVWFIVLSRQVAAISQDRIFAQTLYATLSARSSQRSSRER